jgi:Spy/CpxP family protein refolding chaperone
MHGPRPAAARLLLVAALVVAAARHAAAEWSNAGPWGTCGGVHGPNGADALGASCPDGYTCVRQDE